MSVLATAVSVVACKSAVDDCYPGGTARFQREAPADTFCSDGILLRAGFGDLAAAQSFVKHLRAHGLRAEAGGHAADCVIVDERRGPLSACLWIEFARNRFGVPLCWHTAGRRGQPCTPPGWRDAVAAPRNGTASPSIRSA